MAGKESPGDELWCVDPFTPNSIIPEWRLCKINNTSLLLPSKNI